MSAIAGEAFRRVLGRMPTGVVVVASTLPEGPVGMACNSFTSVSLDPPLVSFCAAASSTTWPLIQRAGRFCVNVLARHHEEVSRRFALRGADRFAGVAWSPRPAGPGLDDAVAWIDCTIEDELPAGDHVIVVGRVLALEARDGAAPLLFYGGAYGGFDAAAHAPANVVAPSLARSGGEA